MRYVWILLLLSGCVAGGGGTVGLYADTRADIGLAIRGHSTMLGFRVSDAPDDRPAAAPLLGIEVGPSFSFRHDVWHLHTRVPIGAATWDDIKAEHGLRISPAFVMDYSWRYGGSATNEAWGAGAGLGYLRHVAYDGEHYDGPDAHRIHRLGPVFSFSVVRDNQGWLGTFLLGLMYDYEAYVATGN